MERDEFIGSSLTSSSRLSKRMLAWSNSNNRGRLFAMKFHEEWQHKSCPVMGWYDQQRKSSTKFQFIEHRRNIEGPFFHEFLLLKLTDGAICRIECTGEGLRADAIRYIGCTAHDLIQWFTKSDYDRFSAKCLSVLITEVDLCREFDILDVLAVCYSIQNIKTCRVYTLQRYNCYFLCLTVLAVLTRRVASWETVITSDDWNLSLSSLLQRLSSLSLQDSMKYPILRICALLEPDNPQPGRFILDGLRVHLTSQAGALTSYNQAMNATLWQTAGESALHHALITLLRPTVPNILGDKSYCGKQFCLAIHTSRKASELAIQSDKPLANHYSKAVSKQLELMVDRIAEIYKKLWQMREIEHPTPFRRQALSPLLSSLGGVVGLLAPAPMIARSSSEHNLGMMVVSQMPGASRMKIGSLVASIAFLNAYDKTHNRENVLSKAQVLAREDRFGASSTKLLDELAVKCALSPLRTSLVMANWLSPARFTELSASLVTSDLSQILSGIQEVRQARICLLPPSQDDQKSPKVFSTMADFQETYIRKRIDDHARRVAAHQLAAAPLVCEDISNTMTEVWRLLPSGFGGTFVRA